MKTSAIDVFYSYAREDEALRGQLEKHLAGLQRAGLVRGWHHGLLVAGESWPDAIREQLDRARVVLLLVSADFMASDHAFRGEMKRALSRRAAGKAEVIPILVRACDWAGAPFAGLQALPSDGRPVTSWPNEDEAWTDVARGIRRAIERLQGGARPSLSDEPSPSYPDEATRTKSLALEATRARRASLVEAGANTVAVDAEILSLRREMRVGGQLRAGDSLGEGRYLLLESIGKGGFATVWKARDRQEGRDVAVKVLHAQHATDPIRRERFERGARVMAELGHPSVVRVLEAVGVDEGFHYFVMELACGGDLRRAVLAKKLGPEGVLDVVLQVGEALAAAHAKKLVHRDVKPANVLLDASGAPKLADFDLVGGGDTTGGTRTGAMGTLLYAAPEQMTRPQDADARVDVYGLGMTAIFGLLGRDLSIVEVGRAKEVVDGLGCDARVREVLKRAVAWDVEDRYADAGVLCAALREARLALVLPDARSSVSVPTMVGPASPWKGRSEPGVGEPATLLKQAPRRFAWAGGATLALAGLVAVGGFWRPWDSRKVETSLGAATTPEGSTAAPPLVSAPPPVAEGECPSGMIAIAGGTFTMGSAEGEGDSNERPAREVKLSAFCMDRTEVTVAAYGRCVDEARGSVKCTAPDMRKWCNWGKRTERGEHPINCVDWEQASAYCQWLGGGARLPTEAEWEYAARGKDGRTYPWGNEKPDETRLNAAGAECVACISKMYPANDGWPETAPVGSYEAGASPFGVMDMAGNVWEWTADWYARYDPAVLVDPVQTKQPDGSPSRVVRGGAWYDYDASGVRAAVRSGLPVSDRGNNVGFRCARGSN